jgi:hypothetical protein
MERTARIRKGTARSGRGEIIKSTSGQVGGGRPAEHQSRNGGCMPCLITIKRTYDTPSVIDCVNVSGGFRILIIGVQMKTI